jgi:hypothetical protein
MHDLGRNSFTMEEPNVDEQEQAMGFCIGTIVVRGLFEGACRQLLT